MDAADVLRLGNVALLTVLAVLAAWKWRAHRSYAAEWLAFAFIALAGLFGLRALVGDPPAGALEEMLGRISLALAAVFPYFLFRFSDSFYEPRPTLRRAVAVVAAVAVVWGLALPPDAFDRTPRPGYAWMFVAFVLAEWAVLLLIVAVRLWRAGTGQASVVRVRMRLLAVASVLLTAGVFVGGLVADEGRPSALDIGFRGLLIASALLFFLGFAPPRLLRIAWRHPEQERFRATLGELLRAETSDEVLSAGLPQLARVVGARAVALLGPEGELVGSHGVSAGDDVPSPARDAPARAPAAVAPIRLATPGGSLVVWASPSAPFLGNDDLELLRSLATFTELVADRARGFARERDARLALQEAGELKDTFLAAVSHELRTPLTSILGFALTLAERRRDLSDAQVDEAIAHLVEQSHRLERLLGDLLDLDRLSRGAVMVERRDVHLGELVRRVVAGTELQGRNVDVRTDPLVVRADAAKLERIVENLVVNAIRHTPAGTDVWVSVERDADAAVIVVEDAGAGVPAELRERIFEPFERGGTAAPGTGIGLSLVARLTELHGGSAWVEDRPGGGASFRIRLPLADVEASAWNHPPVGPGPSPRGAR